MKRHFIESCFAAVLLLLGSSCGKFNLPDAPGGGGGEIPGWDEEEGGSGGGSSTDNTPSDSAGVVIDKDADSDDLVANTSFDAEVTIIFSSSSAAVEGSVEGVTITKNGAKVTATNTGDKKVKYILKGSSSDGCFKLYSDKKQAIVLSDLQLTNSGGAAINNQSKKRTFVVLEGTSSLADGSVNTSGSYTDETSDEDMKAAFFSEGQLVFSGSGTLKVTATGKAGITSDDYVRFFDGPTVNVSSAKGHGVRGKDAVIVSGGTINVTLSSTATGKKCFTSDSLVYFGGGKTTLTNAAGAGTVDGELTGAACIKADQLFVIQGGTLDIKATGKGCKGINGDGLGYFEGGTLTVSATGANYGSSSSRYSDSSVSSKAVKFDGKLELSGCNITANCSSHEAIESKATMYISGGVVSALSSDDCINSASTMTISGGTVYAYSTGNDGIDSNGNLYMTGGTVYAIGKGSPEVAIDANTEGGYKFYLQGGNLIAIGGIESGSQLSQPVISTSWNRSTTYSLLSGESVLYSFKTQTSGGSGLVMSAPSLVSGQSYTLKTGATVSGATSYCDGALSIGGTATGGTSTSVTASTSSSGGGNQPGGGGGGGGRRW